MEADELFARARKAEKGSFWSKPDLDSAADCYEKAGHRYKMTGQLERAAESYAEAARCSDHAMASLLRHQAVQIFAKTSPDRVPGELAQCIELAGRAGQFDRVARYRRELAEHHERTGNDALAVHVYREAIENMELSGAGATACKKRMASLCIRLDRYAEAAQLYAELAADCQASGGLEKYALPDLVGRAVLCHLANDDWVAARRQYDRAALDLAWLDELLLCLEKKDLRDWTRILTELDSRNRMEPWMIKLLLVAREKNFPPAQSEDLGLC